MVEFGNMGNTNLEREQCLPTGKLPCMRFLRSSSCGTFEQSGVKRMHSSSEIQVGGSEHRASSKTEYEHVVRTIITKILWRDDAGPGRLLISDVQTLGLVNPKLSWSLRPLLSQNVARSRLHFVGIGHPV